MSAYQCVLVLKFLSVFGFVGGAFVAFMSADFDARKRAARLVASPCLIIVWAAGYALLVLAGLPLFELWVVASVFLSLVANTALAFVVTRGARGLGAALWVALPVVAIVVLMVLRPSWAQVTR